MRTQRLLMGLVLSFVLMGCQPKNAVTVGGSNSSQPDDATTFTNPVSPNTQVTDPTHGKETGLSIGPLSGQNDALANGVVTAYYFEDKATIVGIQLNITPAKDGKVYAAWLESNDSKARIRLGNLENTFGDVRHSLRFDTQNDLRSYGNVLITLQQKPTDIVPGSVVASGILKATKR